MPRRVSLPAADDLFRPTVVPDPDELSVAEPPPTPEIEVPAEPERRKPARGKDAGRTPSGRVRHDEKMTVYITSEELLDLEHARLMLRRDHGLAVDRGRLVRQAVAIVLADLEENGDASVLVQRLNQA